MIDFAAIKFSARMSLETLLPELLPEGRRVGSRWVALNPTRPDRHPGSFSVSLDSGIWGDFATGDGGDIIALVAYLMGCSQLDSAKWLQSRLGVVDPIPPRDMKRPPDQGQEITPVPVEAPAPNFHIDRPFGYTYTNSWALRDEAARLLGYRVRFDPLKEGDRKIVATWTYRRMADGKEMWRQRGFRGLSPLYGRERLATRPNATVAFVEGEKTADAIEQLIPQLVGVTTGGANSLEKGDLSGLRGRDVIVCGDADVPGSEFTHRASRMLLVGGAASVRIVELPEGLPLGWDVADPIPLGVDVLALFRNSRRVNP